MYMQLLVFVGLASTTLAQRLAQNGETDVLIDAIFGSSITSRLLNQSLAANQVSDSQRPVVNMNGNYNYQAAQQVFFVNTAPNQWSKTFKGCVMHMDRDDYVVSPGFGIHKLHRRRMKWNQARRSCMEEGGQLAVLESQNEETYLLNWMKKENIDRVWLGLHDQFEEGDWVTLAGNPVDSIGYEKWSNNPWPNQPDNYGGRQNCAALIKEGGMDDTECDSINSYVCELTIC